MAFFGGDSKQESKKTNDNVSSSKSTTTINSATIITIGTEIIGTLRGNDSVHIDGTIKGDIIVNNMVVIGKSGIVEGTIRAQKVMISGQLDGSIVCDDLEILESGRVRDEINAISIILDGTVQGEIIAEKSIHVTQNGKVNAKKIMSQNVMVDGTINGEVVATELLEIGKKGYVEGNITVKNIKTHEGGRIIGSMATYMESIQAKLVEDIIEVDDEPSLISRNKNHDLMLDEPRR